MTKTLLSFGHGYSAQELSKRLLAQGWRVIGTTRSAEKAEALRAQGVEPILWPEAAETAAMEEAITSATHILTSISPNATGDPVIQAHRDQIAARADRLDWVGYLSTTGVYGDHQGEWVDEETALTPSTQRGKERVLAEGQWWFLAKESRLLPLHIFRLAGIYGPGRGPFAKVKSGKARRIIKENQIFSRIHVEDIANVLEASIKAPRPGRIYNVCDNEAAPPEDVIGHAAELLGLPMPPAVPIEEANLPPMAASFYSESRRVSNARIREELGVTLAYPTYREGLASLLAYEQNAKKGA